MDINTITVVSVIACVNMASILFNYFMKGFNAKKNYDGLFQADKRHDEAIAENKEINKALVLAMKALLKNELKQLHREYMDRGNITADELDNFSNLYNAYHALGGNGTGTKFYNDVLTLEIVE